MTGTAADLTVRELEALRLYARIGSYKEVGAAMGISANTVKGHLSRCYLVLGVSTAAEAYRAMGWLVVP